MSNTETMTMIDALNNALDLYLERDERAVIMGEDIGYFGGVFRVTSGLQEKYGTDRVFDRHRTLRRTAFRDDLAVVVQGDRDRSPLRPRISTARRTRNGLSLRGPRRPERSPRIRARDP